MQSGLLLTHTSTGDPQTLTGRSFHTKMGKIKVRKDKDLAEAEEIKKWQENTE